MNLETSLVGNPEGRRWHTEALCAAAAAAITAVIVKCGTESLPELGHRWLLLLVVSESVTMLPPNGVGLLFETVLLRLSR